MRAPSAIGDRAVAIVGPSGSGKSTIAAALVRRGATLIAEDVLPLTMCDGGIVAIPAYAGIRLWPEAVELLMHSRDALPLISPTWDKRILEDRCWRMRGNAACRCPRSSFSRIAMPALTPGGRGDVAGGEFVSQRNARRGNAPPRVRDFSDLAATIPLRSIRATHDRDPDILASLCTTSTITAG